MEESRFPNSPRNIFIFPRRISPRRPPQTKKGKRPPFLQHRGRKYVAGIARKTNGRSHNPERRENKQQQQDPNCCKRTQGSRIPSTYGENRMSKLINSLLGRHAYLPRHVRGVNTIFHPWSIKGTERSTTCLLMNLSTVSCAAEVRYAVLGQLSAVIRGIRL